MRRRGKYGAIKTTIHGITFHSKKEAGRYLELLMLQKAGAIKQLMLQEIFPIWIGEKFICNYIADFTYTRDDKEIIEDVKGVRTAVFNLKWKLMAATYPDATLEIWPPKKRKSTRRR